MIRIHRVRSADGTQIAGRVEGQGPPLVLVNGGLDDGDTSWGRMLPRLAERFTCYLLSTRGRGFSADHPDHSSERLVEDIAAFVDSIGEPVHLAGESDGAVHALGAAARSAAVSTVFAYEPGAPEALGAEEAARLEELTAQLREAVDKGRLDVACRMFAEFVVNEDELAAVSETSYLADTARYVPVLLREIEQQSVPGAWSPTDPTVLRDITAPVLLGYGTESALRWLIDGAHHVAAHVAEPHVREFPGLGHLAVGLGLAPVADELIEFLTARLASV